jgi:hypothetical protein
VGWHGLARSRIRYPLLANAVQCLLTAMVGQDREEANRLQQAKWELTSRIRDARFFKGIICDDISEFESDHLNQAVGSLSGGRGAIAVRARFLRHCP